MRKATIARKSSRRRLLRRQRLALALAMVLLSPAAWSQTLPGGGTVASGTASSDLDVGPVMNPSGSGTSMTITQSSQTAIINWESFNVASGTTLTFNQILPDSVTLNRVVGIGYGPSPSYIQGTITANGSIFLVNSAGILFGSSAVVNVGGLVASTLDISDTDFLNGAALADPHYIFTETVGVGAPIVNQGQLTAAAGGTIALLAARIENQPGATISAPAGSVVFGAARGVNLDFYDDGLTTVTLTGLGYAAPFGCAAGMTTSSCLGGIENSGAITAAGGHVEMRTTTTDGAGQPAGTPLFTEASNGGRIWIGGSISAATTSTQTGSIVLDAGMGNVDIGGISGKTGYVAANASGAGMNAGTVDIKAYQLFTHLCVGPGGVCSLNDSLGWIDATAQAGAGNGGTITIDVQNLFYNAGVLQASSFSGNAGLVDIKSGSRFENYNWILAESGGGTGGTIKIDAPNTLLHRGRIPWLGGPGTLYSQAVLSAYGATDGGAVSIIGDLFVVDLGDVTPANPEYDPFINVRGMSGSGGSVDVLSGTTIDIDSTWFANADGTANGGTISLDAQLYLTVDGIMTANGDVDGGTISLHSGYSATISGTLTANGGVTSTHGDGGTITISGDTVVDLYGTFHAIGGTSAGPYPGPSSYGGSIVVSGNTVTLHDGSDFQAVGAGGGGQLSTTADTLLSVQGLASVQAGIWYLGGTEGWIVPSASVGAYSNGIVVADQALGTAVGLDTSVSMVADPSMHSGSGSGHITFVDTAAITAASTSYGGLDFKATQGIYGNNFTIDAGLKDLELDGGNDGVKLGNFTISTHDGSVAIRGSYVNLSYGDIQADANFVYISATDPSGYGLGLTNMSILTSDGDITLNSTGSQGVGISASQIDSGGGDITISADPAGVYISGSSVASGIGDISIHADGSPYYGVWLQNSSVTSNNGTIMLSANGSQIGVLVNYHSTVDSGGGDITISADGSHDGLNINNYSTVDSGGGDITLSADGSVMGVKVVYHAAIDSDGGDITLSGDSASQYGVLVTRYSSVYSHGGAITVHADDSRGGISFWDATIDSEGGDILLTAENAYYNSGVRIRDTSIDGGNITMDADGSSFGVYAKGSTITAAGAVAMHADNGMGIWLTDSTITSDGDIALHAGNSVNGIQINYLTHISSAIGDIDIYGTTTTGAKGVQVYYSSITSTSGDISITGSGVSWGVDLWYADITTTTGAILANGISNGAYGNGVRVLHSDLSTTGGAINLSGSSTGATSRGVRVWYSDLASGGGDIVVQGDGTLQGVTLFHADLSSDGGAIQMTGTGGWYGLTVSTSNLLSDGGDILLSGSGDDSGVGLQLNTMVSSNGGDIEIVGHGGVSYYNGGPNTVFGGVAIWNDSQVTSAGGDIYVLGTGANAGSFGVYLNDSGTALSSGGGVLTVAGDAAGTGLLLNADTSIDGGAGVVVLRAGNDGSSDAIVLGGQIASTTAVNLRPFDATDTLYLGSGNGFVLDKIEFSHIATPWLVLGSSLHQGAIQVLSDISFGGNLTLQNQGGSAGIHLAGALNVSGHTLGLLSGGDITQTSAGAITAESLLAIASGNVLLDAAANDVTGNTLAGSAGGDFNYQDVDALAIGNVSALGFNASSGAMTSQSVSGIWAGGGSGGPVGPPSGGGGDVLVLTQSGNLTLGADVHGTNIDLVAAGIFLNPDGHVLQVASSGSWRIWASTWEGEGRGGLVGSGPLPDLYGCAYLGACGAMVGNGNQFIYVQQPPVSVSSSENSGRPVDILSELEDGSASSSSEASAKASGMCPMTDMVADVALAGSDPLGNDWMKVRKKLNLVNCFSNNRTGGCSGF